ncbi:Uncharacterised protein [Mycobacteroides abscessus subsp. abscessus]|nr:Uncharacterised protein [Mycobacteroides abscessus subsp. abscessus]
MWVGRVRNVRARVMIGPGMVAENSMVCRLAGTMVRMRSISGRKPRSSISSASSSTSTPILPRMRWFCLARSSRRPGVPTTTSTPSRSAAIWES